MYDSILLSLIFLSIVFKRKEQLYAFSLLFILYLLKIESTDVIYSFYPLKSEGKWIAENTSINFILNNSSRIIQHLIMTFVLYFFIYKDRRCFIPLVINTVILVLYCMSNVFILSIDSFDIQRFIYNYSSIMGFVVFLSLIDFGDIFYDRVYNNRVFTNNKYISRLYSALAFRVVEKEAKEESRIV